MKHASTKVRLETPRARGSLRGAWTAEELERLKLNGQLAGYSPLSRLVELEGLAVGIEGKPFDSFVGVVSFDLLAGLAGFLHDEKGIVFFDDPFYLGILVSAYDDEPEAFVHHTLVVAR